MTDNDLQVENGNFTRIVNPLIEELVKIPFKGCELAVALWLIRKTYGFQKRQDSISLTQFQEGLNRSRQTIVTALKNLQLVNVVRLVKKGNMKGASNIWEINKYMNTWNLVNTVRLVQRGNKPSLTERLNLVQTGRHTKETTKERRTKERAVASTAKESTYSSEGAEIIKAFIEVDAKNKRSYGNKTQRGACDFLINEYGLDQVIKVIKLLPQLNRNQFSKKAYTPHQLQENWVAIRDHLVALKTKKITKQTPNFIL